MKQNVSYNDSGICLESPCQTRNSIYVDSDSSYHEDEAAEDSDTENVPQNVSLANEMKPKAVKLSIPLSIFKIDLEKVDNAIDDDNEARVGRAKSNEQRIDFMVTASMPKSRKRKHGGAIVRPKPKFYVQRPYLGYFDPSNKFNLLLYRKCTYNEDEETGDKMKNVHKIRFLYRNDSEAEEIFALPSGSARSVVLKWADSSFPLSIASAILDGQSVTEKEVKNLFENRYLSRFKMKSGESLTEAPEFHLRFAPQIYTKFHANLKDGNVELKTILDAREGAKVKMQVQLQSISFPSGLSNINKYSKLCTKLSAIFNDPTLQRLVFVFHKWTVII